MRALEKKFFLLVLAALSAHVAFCQKAVVKVDLTQLAEISSIETVEVEKEVMINGQKVRRKAKVTDAALAQYDAELERNNIAIRRGKSPQVNFFAYKAKRGDTVSKLAARFCVISDTFVVINSISSQDEEIEGLDLIVPTAKGLFIPDPEFKSGRESQLEILLQKNRFPLADADGAVYFEIRGRRYVFLPDEHFSPTERAFFLDPAMIVPVQNYWVSSAFGNREDPFGSGLLQMHKGMDMAVPEGTEVVACKGGRVAASGEDSVYGKWILLEHSGGISSFYAHLSAVGANVHNGAQVRSGEPIAKSGSTGQVTGPHLHFEVRKDGNSIDPKKYIN